MYILSGELIKFAEDRGKLIDDALGENKNFTDLILAVELQV